MAIQALPSNTVRAISANQVLNDSAAVIKELIDNALDAGATSIAIEVSANVLDVVQVRDNGHGIPQADRELLGHRYCTSKIRDADDLDRLGGSALGFRGEALASIAELSGALSIATRVDQEQTAVVMTFDRKGGMTGTTRASLPKGTLVKVTDFLQSVPVRRRIAAKSSQAMMLKIKHTLQAYAFARPAVRLSLKVLKHTGHCDFLYSPAEPDSIDDVAMKLFGVRCSSQCTLITIEDKGVTLRAFLPRSAADLSRVAGLGGFIACDGRPVSSLKGTFKQVYKLFHKNLQSAAEGCDIRKDVFLALGISCDEVCYDVNVEPAKDDVVFQDPSPILQAASLLFSTAYPRSTMSPPCRSGTSDTLSQQPLAPPSGTISARPQLVARDAAHSTASAASVVDEQSSQASYDSDLLLVQATTRGKSDHQAGNGSLPSDPSSSFAAVQQTSIASYLTEPNSLGRNEQLRTSIASSSTDSPPIADDLPSSGTTTRPRVEAVPPPVSQLVSQTSARVQRGVKQPFVPPSRQARPRDRVWFDHLERYERGQKIVKQRQRHMGRRLRNQTQLGDLVDDPQPLTPPQRNKDIRSFWARSPPSSIIAPPTHPQSGLSSSTDRELQAVNRSVPFFSSHERSASSQHQRVPTMLTPAASRQNDSTAPLAHLEDTLSRATHPPVLLQESSASQPRRKATAQLPATSTHSAAIHLEMTLTVTIDYIRSLAQLIDGAKTVPPWGDGPRVAVSSTEKLLSASEVDRFTSKARALTSQMSLVKSANQPVDTVEEVASEDQFDEDLGSDAELLI